MKSLFEGILRAAIDPNLLEDALDAFCEALDVSSAGVFRVRDFESLVVEGRWGGVTRRGATPLSLAALQAGEDDGDEVAYQNMMSLEPLKLHPETALFGVKTVEEIPETRMRRIGKSEGMLERIGSPLNKSGPWLDILTIQCFREGEGSRLLADGSAEIALPLFAHAVAMGRIFEAMRQRFAAALGVLDHLGLGVFLVSPGGEAMLTNAEARRILDLRDGIGLSRERRLVTATPEATAAVAAMIGRVNRTAAGEGAHAAERLALQRPSGAHPLLVTIRPLLDHQGELETGLRCAFVIVIDPARPGALSAEGLVALGALSPKEAELARLLVAGCSLQEAADRREVSIDTVRNQMKSITAKLRCSGQSDVIRLAAATRLPLG